MLIMYIKCSLVFFVGSQDNFEPINYPDVGKVLSYVTILSHKSLWPPVLDRAQSKLRSGLQLRGAESCWGSILMGPSRSS